MLDSVARHLFIYQGWKDIAVACLVVRLKPLGK